MIKQQVELIQVIQKKDQKHPNLSNSIYKMNNLIKFFKNILIN